MRTLEGFILFYSENCTPHAKAFKTMAELEQFVGRFHLDNGRNDDDWIDSVVEGKVTLIDKAIRIAE